MSPLKKWRLAQMVDDPETGVRRQMHITDAPRLYGIPATTWHCWEQLPGHKDFNCPNPANMRRLCFEITKGAVTPNDFYPKPENDGD